MRTRLDALDIPLDSDRYFSVDLDDWKSVQLRGAAAEVAKLNEEIPPLEEALKEEVLGAQRPEKDSAAEAARSLRVRGLARKEFRRMQMVALTSALEGIPARDVHHFRFPSYARANQFIAWSRAATDPGLSLQNGVLLGMFWWNEGTELEAELPIRATRDQIDEYAAAVGEELQDAGYRQQEILVMARLCDKKISDWLAGIAEAKKLADFTEEQEG